MLGAILTSRSTEFGSEERHKQIIIMQCHKYGNGHVYIHCGCIEEGMTLFIREVHEDITKNFRQYLNWILGIKAQSSPGREWAL